MTNDESFAIERAAALAAYGRHLAVSFSGRVDECAGVQMCDAKLAWRSRNMVVPLRPLDDVTCRQLNGRLMDFYGSDRWVLWSTFHLELAQSGFRLAESHPVMTRPVANIAEPPSVEGLSIKEVTDDAGVRLFERIRQTADEHPPPYDATPGRFFDARVLGNGHRLWLGYIDNHPVATAAAFEHDRMNLIKNVSTAATHRGRGIGHSMSEHAARSSKERPSLDGAAAAVPMYRNLGFAQTGQVDFWVHT